MGLVAGIGGLMKVALVALVAVLLGAASFAADRGWELSAGLVDNEFDTGFNLTAGYAIDSARYRVSFNVIDLNMFTSAADGFRTESTSAGTEICRDLSNGQFAASGNCTDEEFDFAVSVADDDSDYQRRPPERWLLLAAVVETQHCSGAARNPVEYH